MATPIGSSAKAIRYGLGLVTSTCPPGLVMRANSTTASPGSVRYSMAPSPVTHSKVSSS